MKRAIDADARNGLSALKREIAALRTELHAVKKALCAQSPDGTLGPLLSRYERTIAGLNSQTSRKAAVVSLPLRRGLRKPEAA